MVDNQQSGYYEYFKIIQNSIDRIGRNSFLIKGWTITLIGGISILTFSIINILISSVLVILVLLFWILDSYYLRIEKVYRVLYNKTVKEFNDPSLRESIVLFDMDIEKYYDDTVSFLKVMRSHTEILFYFSLIAGLFLLLLVNFFLP